MKYLQRCWRRSGWRGGMALGKSENVTLVWPAVGKRTRGVMGVVMNDSIHLKSLFIVSTIAGLHLHLVLSRYSSGVSLHKTGMSDKVFHHSQWTWSPFWSLIIFLLFFIVLYSFIKNFFELYHHKSHSVCLHCLFHYKWEWDEVVRHMDQSDSKCGTVSVNKIKLFSNLLSHRWV